MKTPFKDLTTPTVLLTSIFLPLLIEHLNEILSGVRVDPIKAIVEGLDKSSSNPLLLVKAFLLGDVMPYLYALTVLLAYAKMKGFIASIKDELGLNPPRLPIGAKSILVIGVLTAWLAYYIIPLMPYVRPDKATPLILAYTLMPISISEELIFRGFMLSRLLPIGLSQAPSSNVKPLIPSALLNATYFSIAHMPIYALAQGLDMGMALSLLNAFLFGVITCMTAISFGSVIPCVIMHWITDFMIFSSY